MANDNGAAGEGHPANGAAGEGHPAKPDDWSWWNNNSTVIVGVVSVAVVAFRSRNRLRNPSDRGNWNRSYCYAGLHTGLASAAIFRNIRNQRNQRQPRAKKSQPWPTRLHQYSAVVDWFVGHANHSSLYVSCPWPTSWYRCGATSTTCVGPHQNAY